ncbi:MAG: class I SAM-dependent methyltransferase [Verrucomicrobiales bacterium]
MPKSGISDLIDRISGEIEASPGGAIPFSRFMQLALYDPLDGYYAGGSAQRVGRAGDFYTSVSVGECFGKLLASHFLSSQPELDQVVEQGANDGQLAADLLANLPAGVDYVIIEPHPKIRARQLARLGERVRWVDSIDEIRGGIRGRFVCNELLDAFPVQRVRRVAGGWREIYIDASFEEITLPITDARLDDEVAGVLGGRDLPEAYTSEIHLQANAWIEGLSENLQAGSRATIIDYGHEADDYYSPARNDGTLRGFREHQQTTHILEHIGETDLTASLNFSRLAELAGAPPATDQHHFLIAAARPWLGEIEAAGTAPDAAAQKLLRQFNTLIHPGLMGRSFKVLEISR